MENTNTNLNNYEYNGESLNNRVENTGRSEWLPIDGEENICVDGFPHNTSMTYAPELFIILLIILLIINIVKKNKNKVIFGVISCSVLIISIFLRGYCVSKYSLLTIITYVLITGILGLIGVIYCFPRNGKKTNKEVI